MCPCPGWGQPCIKREPLQEHRVPHLRRLVWPKAEGIDQVLHGILWPLLQQVVQHAAKELVDAVLDLHAAAIVRTWNDAWLAARWGTAPILMAGVLHNWNSNAFNHAFMYHSRCLIPPSIQSQYYGCRHPRWAPAC